MNYQDFLVGITLIVALAYLVKRFFIKDKSKKPCGEDKCGCA